VVTGEAELLDSVLPVELSEPELVASSLPPEELLDPSFPVELSEAVLEEVVASLPVELPDDFSPVEPPLVALLARVAAELRRLRAGSCPEASCT
jgi:hypothetical protein